MKMEESGAMAWFVLYVRSGSEDKVMREIHTRLGADAETFIPFLPTKILPTGGKDGCGGKLSKRELCYPGYIFFRTEKTETCVDVFLTQSVPRVTKIDGAYFFLYYGGDKRDIAMRDWDRERLERLMNADFCIEASFGFKEGDRIRITKGALVGLESDIMRFNKHNRTAVIKTELMGRSVETTVMLNIVEKV